MTATTDYGEVSRRISGELGVSVQPHPAARVQGGCSNDCFRWQTGDGPIFVKIAAADAVQGFESETAGLDELRGANAVLVPRVLACGVAGTHAYLALQWLDLGAATGSSAGRLGEQLALQHRRTAESFGWHRDNTFDPAVYYADREVDIAMTRLFGGFGTSFYAVHESAWPLDPGAERRRAL
jgi:protein-ribulosamine 3-kinase